MNSIDRKTLNIALPLILSNITIPLVGFVDNLVMGHLGSSIYIGAIGIGSIIISYILFSFGFIKSITTGHISQTNGLGDYEKLFTSLSQIFVITFIISFLIILLRTNIIDLSMQLMDASASVKENSTIYLEYRIWSVPAIFLRDILIGYLIGIQRTRLAMMIVISINFINILLDFYFVFGLNMKIEGVAIASLIAEYSIIFFIMYIFTVNQFHKYLKITRIFDWISIRKKILINFDMFVRSFILMTCFAYFMSKGASYGNITLAANTILINLFFIFSHGIDGFAHASEALVGESYGKKDKKSMYSSILITGKYSFILSAIFIIFLLILSDPLIRYVTNLELVHINIDEHIHWLYLVCVAGTIAFWLDGVFIGLLFTKLMRNVMILSGFIFIIFESFILEPSNSSLWLSLLIFFSIRSLLLSCSLYIGMRKNVYV